MNVDAETFIADFLGDIEDGHERIRDVVVRSKGYDRWRELAKLLVSDLKDAGLVIVPAETKSA